MGRLTEVIRISRPSVWITSLLPFCLGYVLATHRFVPASCTPLTGSCLSDIRPLLTGILIMGPLMWLAILAINDAHDLAGDLNNPRKIDKPLTTGRISAEKIKIVAYVAAVIALVASSTIGFAIAALTFAFLALGWMYSVPPLRLKTRPGWDVATNAVAVGGLALVAGWTVAEPISDFPWIMSVLGLLVGSALYLPTTLADYQADVEAGYTTVGVRLGRRRAHYIGLATLTVACAIAIVLAARGYVFPQRMLWLQIVAAPILIGAYHFLLVNARQPAAVVRGAVVVTLLFSALNVAFTAMYVGWI